jgi:5-methylthioadenosine/S-adenosylhomocysteine deaminase
MTTNAGSSHWPPGCACCAGATPTTRRGFLAGTAALGAASGSGFLASLTGASAQGTVAPRGGEFVIRGGYVITMDKAAGDIPAGDVHVRDGAIVGVAPSIAAPGAETIDAQNMIVMPGFIETHSHCWNALLKNMRRPGVDYFPLKTAFGKHHTPTDYYRAVRLFMTDALNAGITTVINYAHNTQSPTHVDAEIRAMMESGLRGRYAYSGPDPYPNDKTIDFDDVLRVKRTFFSQPDNLIDLGYGLRPSTPLSAPLTVYPQEFRFAVDNGLPIILHSGSRPGVMNPAKLQAEGFSKNMIFVHSLMFDQKDREVMAETGTSNSFSLYNDLRNQLRSELREQILDMVRLGVNVCLSHDATSLNPTSMFDQMRLAWHIATGVPGTPLEKMRDRASFAGGLSRSPKNRGPFQRVPVMACAILDRLGYVVPFQAKPSASTATRCIRPSHSRARIVPGRISAIGRLLSTARWPASSGVAAPSSRRLSSASRSPNRSACSRYASNRNSRWRGRWAEGFCRKTACHRA